MRRGRARAGNKLAGNRRIGGDQRTARLPPPARASCIAWRALRYGISVATGPKASVECTAGVSSAAGRTAGSAGRTRPGPADPLCHQTDLAASGDQPIHFLLHVRALFGVDQRTIFTPSCAGSPTTTFSRRAISALVTASIWLCGTIMRRMAVHFCPALAVISRTTSG